MQHNKYFEWRLLFIERVQVESVAVLAIVARQNEDNGRRFVYIVFLERRRV